jgi:hypothetical protein
VLIEELGGIHLSINALDEFQHNIMSFTALGSVVVLGKLHVDRALLRILAEGQGEVNLTRDPAIGSSQEHSSTDNRPGNKRRVRVPFIRVVFQITTETPTGFELVEASILRMTFDLMLPSARDHMHTRMNIASVFNVPCLLSFQTINLRVHGGPLLLSVRTRKSLLVFERSGSLAFFALRAIGFAR